MSKDNGKLKLTAVEADVLYDALHTLVYVLEADEEHRQVIKRHDKEYWPATAAREALAALNAAMAR